LKRLFLAVLLTLPLGATSVTYEVVQFNHSFSLVAPDFLPTLFPGQTDYIFSRPQLLTDDCGAIPNLLFCGESGFHISTAGPGAVVALQRAFTNTFLFSTIEAFFIGADLGQVGTWNNVQGNATLTISQSDATPTLAPEPSAFLLAGAGLVLLVGVKYSRRLRNGAVNPEVVVSPSR
jgi:hypothetical protein